MKKTRRLLLLTTVSAAILVGRPSVAHALNPLRTVAAAVGLLGIVGDIVVPDVGFDVAPGPVRTTLGWGGSVGLIAFGDPSQVETQWGIAASNVVAWGEYRYVPTGSDHRGLVGLRYEVPLPWRPIFADFPLTVAVSAGGVVGTDGRGAVLGAALGFRKAAGRNVLGFLTARYRVSFVGPIRHGMLIDLLHLSF
jgi:hypothetical protein